MTNQTTKILKDNFYEYRSGFRPAGVPCEICGVKNKKGGYWRTFKKVSWFRGDDEVRGNLCDPCYQTLKGNKKRTKV